MRIRDRAIMTCGAALVLPVIAFFVVQIVSTLNERERAVERDAINTAERLLDTAEFRLAEDKASLRALAAAYGIQGPQAGDPLLTALKEEKKHWKWIGVVDTTTGEVLASVPAAPIETGIWREDLALNMVGGVGLEPALGPCVRLGWPLPAPANRMLWTCLDPVVFQNRSLELVPDGAVTAIVDRKGNFVTRSLDFDARVGTPATEYVRKAASEGGSGIYEGQTYEGLVNYSAYVTSPSSGWSAHVAIDRSRIDDPGLISSLVILIGGLFALIIAAGLVLVTLLDLNRQRESERRALELQKSEAIADFVNSAVHDFRNLVAVMQGVMRMISRATQEEKVQSLVSEANKALERSEKVVTHLLSFARREGDVVEPVDLAALFADSGALLERMLGPRIILNIDINPAAAHVMANPATLELAFLNLAANARDAMEGNGTFSVRSEPAGEECLIVVSDTGPGIPVNLRTRLFDAYFTTKPPGKGTGLGLAQVAGAIGHAEGRINVGATPEGGAEFRIWLNCPQAEDTPGPA